MTVRGWLMIGGPEASRGLPPAATAGVAYGTPPDATEFEVGRWVLWTPAPGQEAICLVCVEIPLA